MERKLHPFIAAVVAPPLRPECSVKSAGFGTPIWESTSLKALEAPCREKAVPIILERPLEGRKEGKSGPSKGKQPWQKASHCSRRVYAFMNKTGQ